MQMKLEVAKKYVCRNAPEIKYVEIVYFYDGITNFANKYKGEIHFVDSQKEIETDTWQQSGRWNYSWLDTINQYDLVAEYRPELAELQPESALVESYKKLLGEMEDKIIGKLEAQQLEIETLKREKALLKMLLRAFSDSIERMSAK